jgi:hypothetical protein
MIIEKIVELKKSRIKQWPCNSNRASELGHPCVRYLVYCRNHWQDKTMHDVKTQMVFDEGIHQERYIIREMIEAGVHVIEQQRAFDWPEYQITGHIDCKIVEGDNVIPCEIKTSSPYVFNSLESIQDLTHGKYLYLRKYPTQLNLYLLMDNKECGLFLFKNKTTGELKELFMDIDYQLGEDALAKAEKVNKYVAQKELPDRIPYTDETCENCPFMHICLPEVKRQELIFENDEYIRDVVNKYMSLKSMYSEYNTLDDKIKNLFMGRDKIVVGNWLITGKWIKSKTAKTGQTKMNNSNVVSTVQDESQIILSDHILQAAEHAEKRIAAINKVKRMALLVTNKYDWIDQNGRPYLQVSGAEKVARLFGISWRVEEPVFEEDADGHFRYTYKGEFSAFGATIEAVGTRGSKDKFFSKSYEKIIPPSEIDKSDVKKSAYTNCIGNGITRLLGIRNLTYDDLAGANIIKGDLASIKYKKKEKGGEAPKGNLPPHKNPPQAGAGKGDNITPGIEQPSSAPPSPDALVEELKNLRVGATYIALQNWAQMDSEECYKHLVSLANNMPKGLIKAVGEAQGINDIKVNIDENKLRDLAFLFMAIDDIANKETGKNFIDCNKDERINTLAQLKNICNIIKDATKDVG